MAQNGDTVTLKAKFHSIDGEPANISNPKVIIYDNNRNILDEFTENIAHLETGIYSFQYTIPDDIWGYVEFEFSGTIDDKPAKRRKKLDIEWS